MIVFQIPDPMVYDLDLFFHHRHTLCKMVMLRTSRVNSSNFVLVIACAFSTSLCIRQTAVWLLHNTPANASPPVISATTISVKDSAPFFFEPSS